MPQADNTLVVLSAGAPKAGLIPCAAQFSAGPGGVPVDFRFQTAPALAKSLDQLFDSALEGSDLKGSGSDGAGLDGLVPPMVVAPTGLCAQLEGAGRVVPKSRVRLGGIGAAMLAHKDASPILTGTVEQTQEALLAAPAVVFNKASSGTHIEKMLDDLALLPALEKRIVRTDTGAQVIEAIASKLAPGAIGFGQSTEIRRLASMGVVSLGPLPGEFALTTIYEAALLAADVEDDGSARAFLKYLQTDEALRILRDAGVE